MNRLQTTLILMVALLFLAGCAATPPTVEQKDRRRGAPGAACR